MIVVDRLGNVQTNGEGQNNLLKKLYGTFLGRCALKILVCKFVSDLGGWYMNSSLSKRRIAPFNYGLFIIHTIFNYIVINNNLIFF